MRRRARGLLLVLVGALALPLRAASFPPLVESLRPQLAQAERRLQDATLAHAAAQRESEPASEAVTEARKHAEHWWGRWLLRRDLNQLKGRLDKVEAARVEKEAARQQLFLLLTGAEEELRGALERGLQARESQAALKGWWVQERAWSQRLESLEAAYEDARLGDSPGRFQLLAQARLEQLQRDRLILKGLKVQALISGAEAQRDAQSLKAAIERVRRRIE